MSRTIGSRLAIALICGLGSVAASLAAEPPAKTGEKRDTMIYVRSDHYVQQRRRAGLDLAGPEKPVLFGEKEGKIAIANRQREPLLLFAAMERHLGYPTVPRPKPVDEAKQLLPNLLRRVDRLEARVKLLEEEQKGGIDLSKFFGPQSEGGLPGTK